MSIHPAYVAGIMDGEGTVTITRTGPIKKGKTYYTVRVLITNTHLAMLEAIQLQYGGRIVGKYNKIPSQKSVYALRWWGKDAIALLDIIEPYMIIKRKQAEIVREFQTSRDETAVPIIRTLNKRGPA